MSKASNSKIDQLAIASSRVLCKFGIENTDYSEWRDLKDTLLKIMPHLGKEASEIVGRRCSEFIEIFQKDHS